jgi:hypothetical protein
MEVWATVLKGGTFEDSLGDKSSPSRWLSPQIVVNFDPSVCHSFRWSFSNSLFIAIARERPFQSTWTATMVALSIAVIANQLIAIWLVGSRSVELLGRTSIYSYIQGVESKHHFCSWKPEGNWCHLNLVQHLGSRVAHTSYFSVNHACYIAYSVAVMAIHPENQPTRWPQYIFLRPSRDISKQEIYNCCKATE